MADKKTAMMRAAADNSIPSARVVGRPFPKGQSPNPAGRPKAALNVQELARTHTEAAINTLADCLRDPKLKVQAAEALLNRAWGRPLQALSLEPDSATSSILQHLLAARLVGQIEMERAQQATNHTAPPTIDGTAASVPSRPNGANGSPAPQSNIFEPAEE